MERIFTLFQYILPHQLLSRCTAFLADCESPERLKNAAIALFIRVFGVTMEEAEEPDYRRYASFNDFFTRALRQDARPVADADVTCPTDGVFSQHGDIEGGRLLQAKGKSFSCVDLLGGDLDRAADFDGGQFITIYLSPRDYHRVHMPVAGRLSATTYVPGRLFSVNFATARHVDRLFARNERLVCYFDTEVGPMAMVLVGAMIVAGIETVWAGRVAPPPKRPVTLDYLEAPQPVELARGEEMGRFCLGSTVILLFPPDTLHWRGELAPGATARLHQPLADFAGV